jgi:hypothetical protein
MKTTDFITENSMIVADTADMHRDHEVQMARSDCYNAAKYAIELHKMLKNISEMEGLDGWVSEKITLANDYLRTVHEYLSHEMAHDDEPEVFTMESAEARYAELLENKPDFLDLDKDGNKKEPMKKAAGDKKKKKSTSTAMHSMFGGSAKELTKGLSIKESDLDEAWNPHSAAAEHSRKMQNASVNAAKAEADKATDPKAKEFWTKRYLRLAKQYNIKVDEDRTVEKDKEGNVVRWKEEGEWKKATGKDPRGKVTNMSDKARKETGKIANKKVSENFGGDDNPAEAAITRRILSQHLDLISKYGFPAVAQAIEQVASNINIGPDDEIGSSDVSGWVRQVMNIAAGGVNETTSGSIATVPAAGGKNAGTLFGGSYKQKAPAKKESVIKR